MFLKKMMTMTVLTSFTSFTASAAAAPSLVAPRARTYGEVVQSSVQSFAVVAPIAFGWAAGKHVRQPQMALKLGLRSAQRWGGTSVGFAGGRALSQVMRQTDDVWCSIAGAGAAGILGAPSLGQVPLRVAGFVGMSYLLETVVLPRLQVRSSTQAAVSAPKRRKRPTALAPSGRPTIPSGTQGWTLGTGKRMAWGTRSPWAQTPWGRTIIRWDQKRQAFEDACVARLMPAVLPSGRQ
jgi:hypothetical protein